MPLTISRELIQFLQRRMRKGMLYCRMGCGQLATSISGGSGWCWAHSQEHYTALQQVLPSEARFFEPQEVENDSSLM